MIPSPHDPIALVAWSAQHESVAHGADSPEVHEYLYTHADQICEANGVTEYIGTDSAGRDWRVLVVNTGTDTDPEHEWAEEAAAQYELRQEVEYSRRWSQD